MVNQDAIDRVVDEINSIIDKEGTGYGKTYTPPFLLTWGLNKLNAL